MNTRRRFLQRYTSALAGTAILPALGMRVAARPAKFSAYLGQLNSSFTLTLSTGKVMDVTLARVDPICPANKPELANNRNFRLKFESNSTDFPEQGTYRVSHPALGEQDIFLVPHVSDHSGMVNYTAVFCGAQITA